MNRPMLDPETKRRVLEVFYDPEIKTVAELVRRMEALKPPRTPSEPSGLS